LTGILEDLSPLPQLVEDSAEECGDLLEELLVGDTVGLVWEELLDNGAEVGKPSTDGPQDNGGVGTCLQESKVLNLE